MNSIIEEWAKKLVGKEVGKSQFVQVLASEIVTLYGNLSDQVKKEKFHLNTLHHGAKVHESSPSMLVWIRVEHAKDLLP